MYISSASNLSSIWSTLSGSNAQSISTSTASSKDASTSTSSDTTSTSSTKNKSSAITSAQLMESFMEAYSQNYNDLATSTQKFTA